MNEPEERAYLAGLADEIAERVVERLPDARPLLDAKGLAARLLISERTARTLMGSEIRTVTVGDRSVRVEPAEVDRYLSSLQDD